MVQPLETIAQALAAEQPRPRPPTLQAALQSLERQSRREKRRYAASELEGLWRLRFATGGARARSGFYLPDWLCVEIRYALQTADAGRVENCVSWGPLQLHVTGPIQFRAPRNVLAFDFTQLQVRAFAKQLYRGPMRGGVDREARFPELSITRQAFFTYFWVAPEAIAARGRGGGLALWSRAD